MEFDPETGEVLGGVALEDHASENGHGPRPGRLVEQLSLEVGGEEPTVSLAKFAGSLPLSGQYAKGDLVRFEVTGRVVAVALRDVEDKHGNVVATERIHSIKLHGGGPA